MFGQETMKFSLLNTSMLLGWRKCNKYAPKVIKSWWGDIIMLSLADLLCWWITVYQHNPLHNVIFVPSWHKFKNPVWYNWTVTSVTLHDSSFYLLIVVGYGLVRQMHECARGIILWREKEQHLRLYWLLIKFVWPREQQFS